MLKLQSSLSKPGMTNIWFTSDLHGFHKNICRGVSEWKGRLDATRDFPDIETMNRTILKGINDNVKPDDIMFFLGDWTFGGYDNIKKFRDQISCQNIHLIYGNHDHHIENDNGGIRKIFSSCNYYRQVSIDNQVFSLMHFPMLSWDHSSKGSIMLHGHEHSGVNHLNTNCRRLDVGIDSAKKILGEYRPFSLKEVLDITLKKPVLNLGHHQS